MLHKWLVGPTLTPLTMRLLAYSVHTGVDRLHWHGTSCTGMWRSKGNVFALLALILMFTQYDTHCAPPLGVV